MNKTAKMLREIKLRQRTSEIIQAQRSERMPNLVGAKADMTAALDNFRVAVIGCGSIGDRAAVHLSRLQPKTLLLVDPKFTKATGVLTAEITPVSVCFGHCPALASEIIALYCHGGTIRLRKHTLTLRYAGGRRGVPAFDKYLMLFLSIPLVFQVFRS